MPTSIPLNRPRRRRVPLLVAFGALVATGVQAADLPEVTVTAPSTKTIGRDASGAPLRQVTASARIRYSPVMLTTYSGQALLQDRVVEVARGLCRKLGGISVVAMDDEATCVQQAVKGTKVQIAAAIAQQKAG
jgi:UrcA family protein